MRAISDLHIDDGSGGFKNNALRMHDFLDDAGQEQILYNGDTFDFWKFKWFEILGGPYRGLIDRMAERKDDIVIPGNHDIESEWLEAVFSRANVLQSFKVGNREIFHGFQVDPLLDTPFERWFVSLFDHLMTEVSRLNALRDQIADTSRTNDPLISRLLQMGTPGGHFLLGHSHVEENDLSWFTNSGCLIRNRFPWVQVAENGDCTLKYFGE